MLPRGALTVSLTATPRRLNCPLLNVSVEVPGDIMMGGGRLVETMV
jgi:hypothetical protein